MRVALRGCPGVPQALGCLPSSAIFFRFDLTRPLIISLVGLAAATIALVLALSLETEDEASVTPPPVAASSAEPQSGQAQRSNIPSFDVVRIAPGGDAVIAGRAMPKAEVVILDADKEIGRTIADNRGEWVFVPKGPLGVGARTLSLEAHNPDGSVTRSNEPVILVVPEKGGDAIAFQPLAGGGARLLTGPAGESGPVSVDLLDRDEKGRLFLSGRAPAGSRLHLYADGQFLGRAQAQPGGTWTLSTKAPTGQPRTLRADLVDGKGKVLARVEFPFETGPHVGEGKVVVEPGQSLWRIARKLYGDGGAYTVIYKANKERIRDPDLIYPGQVFQLPKE